MIIMIQISKDPNSIGIELWGMLEDNYQPRTLSRLKQTLGLEYVYAIDDIEDITHMDSYPNLVIPCSTIFATGNDAGRNIPISQAALSEYTLYIF